MPLRMLTAGESHGPMLTVIVDGMPSGLPLSVDDLMPAMRARQSGYGRGGRQNIERDTPEFVGGVRHGRTIGAPIALTIRNRDFANWQDVMASENPALSLSLSPQGRGDFNARDLELPSPLPAGERDRERDFDRGAFFAPRPGHADLAGGLKHNLHDMRDVLERASARETAARVAAGAIAQVLLAQCGVRLRSHVVQIGEVVVRDTQGAQSQVDHAWWSQVESSDVRCGDAALTTAMKSVIDAAFRGKDSIGGVFEVVAFGVPPGLGTYAQWDRRLDGRVAQAMMSIPGVKGVECGLGFAMAARPGSLVHDAIAWQDGFTRATNHAGGLEGGMSNGEPIVVRGVMKPLATLMDPLPTVDVRTKQSTSAHRERADTCVVPAASVIAEAMVAWTLADAVLEKCGGDSLDEVRRNLEGYRAQVQRY